MVRGGLSVGVNLGCAAPFWELCSLFLLLWVGGLQTAVPADILRWGEDDFVEECLFRV